MELLLPKKLVKEKKYKHFTIESNQVKEAYAPASKRIDFFYIGTNYRKVDFLVKAFEGGYVLENVENAIPFLKRNAENQVAPDIIIVDKNINSNDLSRLYHFLLTTPAYFTTPLMLDGSDLSEAELEKYRQSRFVDEIVFLQKISRETLVAKATFLRKIKAKANTQVSDSSLQLNGANGQAISLFCKRAFDIIISFIALLALSPILLLIALLIKLESKGPIFYIAPRAGRGYNIFNFYKFRTMILDADKKVSQLSHLNQYTKEGDGPTFFKVKNDPRITKVGVFLRNTSLDELPQFINVLIGDMSLVGNRPLPLYEAATLTTDEHAARFMAPAGITGLWQIKKRGNSRMSVEERINLDVLYAKRANFFYDCWIIANTPTALIQKSNV